MGKPILTSGSKQKSVGLTGLMCNTFHKQMDVFLTLSLLHLLWLILKVKKNFPPLN